MQRYQSQRKNKLSLRQEKEIYENQWREVYNECFFLGVVNREKIAAVMQSLNVIDTKIIEERNENAQKNNAKSK